MKPIKILEVLDLAYEAKKKGQIINPLFTGHAGLGKSAICQQWVKKMQKVDPSFGFVDLRIAYMEQPDMIGFPITMEKDGRQRTIHALPEFWPTSGSGLLLFEEPNRGSTGIMNCLMQILTDLKVHGYELPPGWIMAAAINPDSAEYDVNSMDAALRNRFVEFEITYDHNSFVDFIEKNNFHNMIRYFVSGGTWLFKEPDQIGKDGKYISPRTWAQMNAAEIAGASNDRMFHEVLCRSILGTHIGKEYWSFCHQQAPVLATDLIKDKKAALKRLTKQSDVSSYQGDMIAATIDSITEHYGGLPADCPKDKIDEDTMAEVAAIIPSDQALNLIKACGAKQNKEKISNFFQEFSKRHPETVKVLQSHIKLQRATGKT